MTSAASPTDGNESHDPQREALEHEADVAKGKLLRTLERLDEKRHRAMETAVHVRNDALIVGVLGGIVLGVVLGEMRAARRRRLDVHPWLRAFRRAVWRSGG